MIKIAKNDTKDGGLFVIFSATLNKNDYIVSQYPLYDLIYSLGNALIFPTTDNYHSSYNRYSLQGFESCKGKNNSLRVPLRYSCQRRLLEKHKKTTGETVTVTFGFHIRTPKKSFVTEEDVRSWLESQGQLVYDEKVCGPKATFKDTWEFEDINIQYVLKKMMVYENSLTKETQNMAQTWMKLLGNVRTSENLLEYTRP